MARILVTSGPTREYLDPVRYLTNASSGRMGRAMTQAALSAGHEVVIVSGPVEVRYPSSVEVIRVVSTQQMLDACREVFPTCDGLIGIAAPCDYRTVKVEPNKITKSGGPLSVHLVETPDIVATLGAEKQGQWLVGFALETEDHRFRAQTKLQEKKCDLMVLNGPEAMNSPDNQVEILDRNGSLLASISGLKEDVAREILRVIDERLIKEGVRVVARFSGRVQKGVRYRCRNGP